MPLAGWQTAFDPLLDAGCAQLLEVARLPQLDDGADRRVLLDAVETLPEPECEVFIAHLGGAINRVPVGRDGVPAPRRAVRDERRTRAGATPAEDEACIAWARGLFDAAAPFATGGVYVNFMPEDETQRVAAAPTVQTMTASRRSRPSTTRTTCSG